jgi:hypothetical protein
VHLLCRGLKLADPVPIAPPGFRLAALLVLEDAQFRRPVRQRQQEPIEIRIAREQLGFDGRDLAPATFDFDSQSFLPAGRRDLPERPAVAFERGFFAAQGLTQKACLMLSPAHLKSAAGT